MSEKGGEADEQIKHVVYVVFQAKDEDVYNELVTEYFPIPEGGEAGAGEAEGRTRPEGKKEKVD